MLGVRVTGLTIFAGWVIRINKGEGAAEKVTVLTNKVDKIEHELSAFKEQVARDYATTNMLATVEGRIVGAIERLGDRMDRILEQRLHQSGHQ